ncbi:hypothetical protein [Pseudomonas sp. YL-218 TE3947]|uniref:hypothetical protein n=1 Tax=Pseudomonas TaxID=286 RepID=UPI003D20FB3B
MIADQGLLGHKPWSLDDLVIAVATCFNPILPFINGGPIVIYPVPNCGRAMTEKYFIAILLALSMIWIAVVWWMMAPYV